jgi:hypothetical protein
MSAQVRPFFFYLWLRRRLEQHHFFGRSLPKICHRSHQLSFWQPDLHQINADLPHWGCLFTLVCWSNHFFLNFLKRIDTPVPAFSWSKLPLILFDGWSEP